jgi:EAL domain-containing protein (putative c-di-GMP-specific phosphodiesterase class I)/GGDEF domain-containing protein
VSDEQPIGRPTAFIAALERQAALARRYDRPGAVVVLAVAPAGERAGRAAADALRARVRATDVVARLAPAEVAVLLPEVAAADAEVVARDLVDLVAGATGARAAAGVACFPEALHRSAGGLMADADAALAAAWRLTPPVTVAPRRLHQPTSRAERIAAALTDGGMELDRVPVMDLRTGLADHHVLSPRLRDPAPAGAEGLRAAAARFGLGGALDRWLVERALAAAEGSTSTLVVPLSAGAAADASFAGWLIEALAARPAASGRLVLALPEAAAVEALDAVCALSARMGEFGTRAALDGFGAVGAIAALRRLRVQQVRLDAALVRGLPDFDQDRAVVLALVQAAEALGAVPVATGVAREAEVTAVRGFGIALAEGAAFNPPR